MSNPNNCKNCEYKRINNTTGHCYMFADEPDEQCFQFKLPKALDPLGKSFEEQFQRIFAKG